MKKENTFILAMFVVGAIAGLAFTLALMMIAVPQFTQYQLTLPEKADWDRIASYGELMTGSTSLILLAVASLVAVTIISILLLRILNPQSMMALKKWKSVAGAKLLVVFLLSLAWLYLIADGFESFYMAQAVMAKSIQFGIYVIGTAVLWFVAGERGWTGDFSSWRIPHDARLVSTALLGAATGAVFFAITYIFDIAAKKYFLLVSEVLDGSGEISFLGFKYLALGFSVQIALKLSLIAGFAAALAPVRRDAAEVHHRLIKPSAAFAAILALLFAAYFYAGKRYDLDKADLASAIGISSKANESKTILILNPSKEMPVTIQEWPLETTGWSLAVGSAVELTEENLARIESYLEDHPEGTVYTYAARHILMNGYYALWDVDRGLAWQVMAAETQLLPRLLLLSRFTSMTVTPGNLSLLESYSDDTKWYHSGRSARSLSMAYHHFGKPAQARAWLQKAKSLGAEIPDTNYLDIHAVTQGTLNGKIYLNDKPLSDVKVGLLSHQTTSTRIESYKLTDLSLARSLQAAVKTSGDGSFTFTNLGNGKYLIAIMTDKSVIPFDLKPGQIKVSNVPGLVQIGPVVNRNLGIIKMVIGRKQTE